jgi:class 3 adenylate cyclase
VPNDCRSRAPGCLPSGQPPAQLTEPWQVRGLLSPQQRAPLRLRPLLQHARSLPAWRRWGHDIGFGIGIAHGFATLGTIGFEGRFDYAAIGTVSNVASRLCDEAKPGQILISARVLTKVENAVKVEPVGEFELKGIRRPLAAYNVISALA